ncbi:hypothetical protein CALCODRAFT_175452 [Calocera cornea HHB12733]|uniref:Uncharacterized protein n=1 Tax=Calocera cornea HHB12733 TaxID=1353952 RepID=A0A165HU36_9BASI|nr:hypothetical protein CALCODRAFT_175452 [Calocera cornea HHB12733]
MSVTLLPCAAPSHPAPAYGHYLSPSSASAPASTSHSVSQLAALISLAHSMSTSTAGPSSYPRRPGAGGMRGRSPSSARLRLPPSLPAPRVPPTLVNSPLLGPGSAFRQRHTLGERKAAREEAERDAWGIRDQVPMRSSSSFSLPSGSAYGLGLGVDGNGEGSSRGRPDLPQRAKSDSATLPPHPSHPAQQPYKPYQPPALPTATSTSAYSHPSSTPGHARTGSTVYSHSRLGPDSPAAAVGAEEEMREYFQSLQPAASGGQGQGQGQGMADGRGRGRERGSEGDRMSSALQGR